MTAKSNESRISLLEQKLNSLFGEVLILNAEYWTSKHVSALLIEKNDDPEQYSRQIYSRSLFFEGLNSVDEDNKHLS